MSPASRARLAPFRLRVVQDRRRLLPAIAVAAITAGGALHLGARPTAGDAVWAGLVAVMLVPLSWSVAVRLVHRDMGVDAIALVAMAGALALGEYLAGAVIALMLSGGDALEAAAGRRARRELTALLERAPRIAHRRRDSEIEAVPVDAVLPGDVVLVRAGEVVPVDGFVTGEAPGVLDESALTGESLPVTVGTGGAVRSGSANVGGPFEVRATRPAADSAYAAIVALVRGAEHERAPFVRMADAYAAWFLPFTTLVAGAAWALSGEPVRALAVFVVATPCPLILAAPIAILSGVSRAARIGVVVKGGRAIEQLGRARTVLVDKTGTLTLGAPEIDAVVPVDRHAAEDVLRLAASLDQASAHVLAGALVRGARARGLPLVAPEAVAEEPGRGIEGRVDGRRVLVGGAEWIRERGCRWDPATAPQEADGRGTVLVAVDGRPAGVVEMGDRVREDAAAAIADLRAAGVAHVAMVSGDSRPVAEAVARQVGIDEVFAERSPEGKLAVVRAMRLDPARRPVVMVGDGVNDAPALAIADIGVAMGAAGATVTAETADAVVTVDRIDRVAAAVGIGRRSLGIARQSVLVGMGLSAVAMGFAAGGALSPVAGALLQEGIDVAVILNALRALGPGHARALVATGRGGRGTEPRPAAGG